MFIRGRALCLQQTHKIGGVIVLLAHVYSRQDFVFQTNPQYLRRKINIFPVNQRNVLRLLVVINSSSRLLKTHISKTHIQKTHICLHADSILNMRLHTNTHTHTRTHLYGRVHSEKKHVFNVCVHRMLFGLQSGACFD